MKILPISVIAAFVAAPIYASECHGIESDLDRLACYDKETGLTPVSETVEPTDKSGDWHVWSETSEFKDTTDVFMTIKSENTLACRNYGAAQKATLVLRCSENTTVAYIKTDCHLASGHGGYGQVEYRFDDKPAGKRSFDSSTDNKALGLWSGGKSIPLIRQMFGTEKAIFRFTPFSSSPVTAKFQVLGIEEAIKPLRESCGW